MKQPTGASAPVATGTRSKRRMAGFLRGIRTYWRKKMKTETTIKERLGDTVVFRSYNIAILLQIRDKLDRLIEVIEGMPTEVVLTEEDIKNAREEFGTTD
jgi:hypothetical protein